MKVKELLSVLNSADSEADIFVSVLLGDSEIDLEVEAVTDLDYAVFIEPERLYIAHGHKTDTYIPKKSPNFIFHIFDPDSGETIARDIPLSDEKAKEIFNNCEKIKAEKPDDKLNQLCEDGERK